MTKDEKKHYAKLAEYGCILCRTLGHGETPSEIHHIRRYGGKRSLCEVIALCPEHHRGNSGVHGLGHKGFERYWGYSEEDLLERTRKLIE